MPIAPIAGDLGPYRTALFEQGPEHERPIVIRDAGAWVTFMDSLVRQMAARPPVPPVDFEREMVVGYALGRRFPMSGPAPEVRGATRRGDTLLVRVEVVGSCPNPDDGSAAPVGLARVPRTTGPVRVAVSRPPCRAH